MHSMQGEQRSVTLCEVQARILRAFAGLYQRTDFNKGGGLAALAKAVDGLGFAAGGHWEIEATVSAPGF